MGINEGLLRLKMQNGVNGVSKAAKHNKRQLSAHEGSDSARSHLNLCLRGPTTAEGVAALAKRLMAEAGIHKLKRKDAITAIEVVSSLPVHSAIDPAVYFEGFVRWVEQRFGAHNVLSADVHLDESAPHCHVLLLPLLDGRLNASGIVGGPPQVNALHAQFYAEFASRYGLRRPIPKLSGAAKNTAARMVIDRLMEDADAAVVSGTWAAICGAIERYPEPFMEALGIERPASVKPSTTLLRLALSTGAGPKTEASEASRDRRLARLDQTPIGVGGRLQPQPLPCGCVGVLPAVPEATEKPSTPMRNALFVVPSPEAEPAEYTRTSDSEHDPANWVYAKRPQPAREPSQRSRKAEADTWVADVLSAMQKAA